MLSNGSDREPARTRVKELNNFLKGRMQCALSVVGRIRDTGKSTQFSGAPHQTRERRASYPRFLCCLDDRRPGQHSFDGSQIPQKALSLAVWESGGIKGGQDTLPRRRLWFSLFLRALEHSLTALPHVLGERVWENGCLVRGKTHQRSQPVEGDGGEIDQQMALGCRIGTSLPDGGFLFRLRPSFSQPLNHLLGASRFTPWPDDLQRLGKGRPSGKSRTPGM